MAMGSTFRRFVVLLLLVGLIGTACSAPNDEATGEDATSSTTADDDIESSSETVEADDSDPETGSNADTSTTAGDVGEEDAPEEASEPTLPPVDEPAREPAEIGDIASLDGQIVLRSDDGAINVVSPDGTDLVELASGATGLHSQPTWSNGGDRVVWSSFVDGESLLSLARRDGSERVDSAAPTQPFYFAWAQDDSWIAGLGPGVNGVELFIAEGDTSDVRRIGSGQPFFIDWTGDGALVAAIGGQLIADIPAPSANPSERDLDVNLGLFQAPAALDPQRTLVATEPTIGGTQVTVLSADAEPDVVARTVGAVTFSPNPTNDTVAISVTSAGPQTQQIVAQGNEVPTLTPNRVSILNLNTSEVETLDITGVLATSWSPDGSTLAVLRTDSRTVEWVFARDGDILDGEPFIPSPEFGRSYVPFADQYERSTAWWSPDSRAIVFAGTVGTTSGVWVDLVDDDRGAAMISDGDIAVWSPAQ